MNQCSKKENGYELRDCLVFLPAAQDTSQPRKNETDHPPSPPPPPTTLTTTTLSWLDSTHHSTYVRGVGICGDGGGRDFSSNPQGTGPQQWVGRAPPPPQYHCQTIYHSISNYAWVQEAVVVVVVVVMTVIILLTERYRATKI